LALRLIGCQLWADFVEKSKIESANNIAKSRFLDGSEAASPFKINREVRHRFL
jgi:hypothetical protein